MNLPYGYTNITRRDQNVVDKSYTGSDARNRFEKELAIYQCLQSQPFMLELVDHDGHQLELRTRYIENNHAQDLLEVHKVSVPRILGQLARKLEDLSTDILACLGWDAGHGVFVHGDFGPQNLIFAPGSLSTYYLVDWEWAHVGEIHEDIAWTEWIIRMHYRANPDMLAALYEGYGLKPVWGIRHRLMVQQCERVLDHASNGPHEHVIAMWRDRLTRTEGYHEVIA